MCKILEIIHFFLIDHLTISSKLFDDLVSHLSGNLAYHAFFIWIRDFKVDKIVHFLIPHNTEQRELKRAKQTLLSSCTNNNV